MGLTVNRQNWKKFTVNCLKSRQILTVKRFQGISNLSISADFHGLLAAEESLN